MVKIPNLKLFLKTNYPFIILIVLSFALHFYHLASPAEVIFDEVHFGKFISAYFTGQYYFDVHPPLGKLLIAGWLKLTGYTPNFGFNYIGEPFSADLFWAFRFLPAFFGSLIAPLFAYFAYLISRSKKTALIAGFLILLDNALLIQTRIIAFDAFLIFFEILALCFFFLYQKEKYFSFKWFVYLILTATSFGLAISIKWTGLATLGIIAAIMIAKIYNHNLAQWLSPANYIETAASAGNTGNKPNNFKKTKIKEFLIGYSYILIIGILVYIIPFMFHFGILTRSISGNIFIPYAFEEKLDFSSSSGKAAAKNPNNPLLKKSFGEKFIELNLAMFGAGAAITKSHPYASKWYDWPIDKKPICYWCMSPTPENGRKNEKIYFLGNPVLWWLAAAFVLLALFKIFVKKERLNPAFYILLLAYLSNFIPFIFMERTTFLYYYLPALVFAAALASFYLASLWPRQKLLFIIILISVILSFLALLPYSYGWPVSSPYDAIMMRIINFLNSL